MGGSFLSKRVDVANRTAYYLLMTNVEGQMDSYTVWFEKVTLGDVDGEAIIPGPFYVTWTPSYDLSSIVTQTMERDGAEIGTLTLSPLSITMDIPELFDTMDTPPEGEALEEFYHIASGILTEEELEALERDPVAFLENRKSINDYVCVSIQYRDGSSQELEVNCSSAWDENSGNVHVWARISLYDVLGTFPAWTFLANVLVMERGLLLYFPEPLGGRRHFFGSGVALPVAHPVVSVNERLFSGCLGLPQLVGGL